MAIIIYICTFILNLALKIVFKLKLGLAIIYYLVVSFVIDDWVYRSQLNETITIIGFFIIVLYCISNAIYGFYVSIKTGY